MSNIVQRLDSIRKWLQENSLDALIIPHDDEYLSEYIPPENERLAWSTGFTGSAGIAIICSEAAAIFVDGRYTVQVKEQVDINLFDILNFPKDSPIEYPPAIPSSGFVLLNISSITTNENCLLSNSFNFCIWSLALCISASNNDSYPLQSGIFR